MVLRSIVSGSDVCNVDLDVIFDFFFFFKQKTAYEMRISDWSSDVCSSDLAREVFECTLQPFAEQPCLRDRAESIEPGAKDAKDAAAADRALKLIESVKAIVDHIHHRLAALFARFLKLPRHFLQAVMGRSEEHTSELQSLMRISYAVFC